MKYEVLVKTFEFVEVDADGEQEASDLAIDIMRQEATWTTQVREIKDVCNS